MRAKTKWQLLREGLEEAKTSINAKLYRFNENYKCRNQSYSNWTFVQHKSGFTKLLKATNRGYYKPELKSHTSAHAHVTE